MNPGTTRFVAALASVAALTVALALPSAGAAKDKVALGEGETTLKLKPDVADALAAAEIGVAPVHPATAGKDGIAFPITGGNLDPEKAKGTIEHSGGLTFTRDDASLTIEDFVVELGKKPRLIASAGAAEVQVFDLDLGQAKIKRDGLGYKVSGVQAVLTKDAATALNDTLGVEAFAKGLVVGKTTTTVLPETIKFKPKGATTLALDAGAAAALESEGISVAPIAGAEATNKGIAFPITGGEANPSNLAGAITHSGGLRFAEGDTELDLKKFTIELDESPDLTAKVGSSRVSILDLDLSSAVIDADGLKLTVSGVEGTLTGDAASALNATFGTSAFTEGLTIGTATVKAFVR